MQAKLGRLKNGENSVLPEGSGTVWRLCSYMVLKVIHQMPSLKMAGVIYYRVSFMDKAREHEKVDSALISSFWSPGRKKKAVSHEV